MEWSICVLTFIHWGSLPMFAHINNLLKPKTLHYSAKSKKKCD